MKPLEKIKPTEKEVKRWLISTIRHVQHIEYYLERLQVGTDDLQRPHDIIGEGNKFEWEVICGFAVQYREKSNSFFEKYVYPSLARHRCQYHHQKWNDTNLTATQHDLKLGAVDAVCSLLEPDRTYQGGKHSFTEICEIIKKNPIHKQYWLEEMVKEMKKIESPLISSIVTLETYPNVGISSSTYEILQERVFETMHMLRERGYFL